MLSLHPTPPVTPPLESGPVVAASHAEPAPALPRKPLRLQTILVPTDFSPASNRALVYAKQLALTVGARLRVLNVVEPMDPPHGALLAHLLLENEATVRTHAQREMAVFADVVLTHEGPPCDFDFRIGRAYEEIVAAAKDMACDLIVLAGNGHSPLARWLIGSTTERVVRLAPCPVLVVREPGS